MISGLGVIAGGVMTVLQKGFEVYTEKQDRKHELDLYDRQAKFKYDESVNNVVIAQNQTQQASYKLEMTSDKYSPTVNNIRGLFRPFITTVLTIAVIADVFFMEKTDPALLVLAETCITWWFGGSMIKKK